MMALREVSAEPAISLLEGGQTKKTQRERELEEKVAKRDQELSRMATEVSHLEEVVKAQKEPPLDIDDFQDSSHGVAPPFGEVGIFEEASGAPLAAIEKEALRLRDHISSSSSEHFTIDSPALMATVEILSVLQNPIM